MEFNEAFEAKTYTPLKSQSIVYFLLDGKEVVYVGHSRKGLVGPFQHVGTKVFDSVKVLEVDESQLAFVEGEFIEKYDPKYNVKILGRLLKKPITFKKELKEEEMFSKITIRDIKKAISALGIELKLVGSSYYLTAYQCEEIKDYLIEEKGGN